MTLSELFDRIKSLVERVPDPSAQLAEKDERIEELAASLAEAEAALATHRKSHDELSEKLAAANASLKELGESVDAKHAEVASRMAELDKEVERKAAAKALTITAAQGQPPIEQPVEDKPKNELRGLDRVKAAFEQQIKS